MAWDVDRVVELVHLWEIVSILVKISRYASPPAWEVLLQGGSKIGSMGCGLNNNLVECFVWSLPCLSLNSEPSCNGQSNWESVVESVEMASEQVSRDWDGEKPSSQEVSTELSTELLKLRSIELLHPDEIVV